MTKLYRYYQQTGGLDPWIAVHANADFYEIKPTFITVLALDTLIEDSPSREQLDAVKYQGPMYFDLDSSDIEQSIEGGKALLEKLLESGLKDHDVEIYLSGKKGLHFIIPQVCFMEKQHPQVRLPAIYKEMAFKLAVDTVDFRVYTARKGRMLRTCHNIRENGNYRVPITAEELRSLDGDTYDLLCKNPRAVPKTSPQFRAEFSLIFDAAQQKVLSVKRKKHKPASQQDLQKVSGDLKSILKGENLVDVGFNKIAMQLAIYAREAGWTEDVLVKQAEGLLNNHQSDGSRYNTPRRREEELRRMFSYVDDNPAYEYQASFLKALIVKQATAPIFDEHGEVEVDNFVLSSGVYNSGGKYTVSRGEDGEQEIASFVFSNIQLVLDARDGRITAIRAKLPKGTVVTLTPNNFTSSTALQNVVSVYGESFTGSDIHARGIYQIMIREAGENSYIVDSEGMNLVKLPAHPDKEVSENAFVMWADRYLTVTPAWVREKGVKMEFVGYPEEAGVIQTDLSKAPTMKEFLSVDGNKERLVTCIKSICKASHAETVAKLLGWMVASHWRPFFQLTQGKYPLLHVFGPAGMGKTEMTQTLLKLFYYKEEPKSTTPSSTTFAFMNLLAGSSSIPVLLDEWKPAVMHRDVAEKYRGIFRDAYNGKEVQRGGGNKNSGHYAALAKQQLHAPMVYISEACESETAILERSVILTFRRAGGRQQGASLAHFRQFQALSDCLPVLGKCLVTAMLQEDSLERFKHEFGTMLDRAFNYFMMQPEDVEKIARGELSEVDIKRKTQNTQPRPIYNSTVVLYGLTQMKRLLKTHLGELFDEELETLFKGLSSAAYAGLTVGVAMKPEYIKVLIAMSDMSRTADTAGSNIMKLVENVDYNLAEIGGRSVLVLATRFAYNKYRAYCRSIGSTALYPNEASFATGLMEIPQFIKMAEGTLRLKTDCVVLDVEKLQMDSVPVFTGKAIDISL